MGRKLIEVLRYVGIVGCCALGFATIVATGVDDDNNNETGSSQTEPRFITSYVDVTVLHNLTSIAIIDALVQGSFYNVNDQLHGTRQCRTDINGECRFHISIEGRRPYKVELTISQTDFYTTTTERNWGGDDTIYAVVYLSPK